MSCESGVVGMCTLHHTTLSVDYPFLGDQTLSRCFEVPGCKRDEWIGAGLIGQFSELIRSVSEFSELVSSVQSARLVTLSS